VTAYCMSLLGVLFPCIAQPPPPPPWYEEPPQYQQQYPQERIRPAPPPRPRRDIQPDEGEDARKGTEPKQRSTRQ
jgi:hypothetical protein